LKRSLQILIFSAALLAGIKYLEQVFESPHHLINTANGFRELSDENNVDILFLGSSHMFASINPYVIDKNTRSISFNLGTDGLRLQFTSIMLEEALKTTKPKLVVVEVFRGSVSKIETEVSKGFQLRGLDFVSNFSLNKFDRVKENFLFSEYPGVYSRLLRNHSSWSEKDFLNLNREFQINLNKNLYYSGYFGARIRLSDELRNQYSGFRLKERKIDTTFNFLKPIYLNELERLVQLSRVHGFELLLMTAPDLRASEVNNYLYTQLSAFADENELNYLNLSSNEKFDELDISFDDFKDASHLNLNGGEKVSQYLSEYINENYSLSDRSNEDVFIARISDYEKMHFGKEVYNCDIGFALTDSLLITNLQILKPRKNYIIKMNFEDRGNSNNKYRIGAHMFPQAGYEDELDENSKVKDRDFDVGTGIITDASKPLEVILYSEIRNIERLTFFLYDINGYKGKIGETLVIKGDQLLLSEQ